MKRERKLAITAKIADLAGDDAEALAMVAEMETDAKQRGRPQQPTGGYKKPTPHAERILDRHDRIINSVNREATKAQIVKEDGSYFKDFMEKHGRKDRYSRKKAVREEDVVEYVERLETLEGFPPEVRALKRAREDSSNV